MVTLIVQHTHIMHICLREKIAVKNKILIRKKYIIDSAIQDLVLNPICKFD